MWNKIASFILRNRLIILVSIALLTVLMVWQASKVEVGYGNKKIIPLTDSNYIVYDKFQKTFGDDGGIIIIGINTPKLFELNTFRAWYDLTQDIDNIKGIDKTVSITKIYNLYKKTDSLGDKFAIEDLVSRKPETQAEVDSIKEKFLKLNFYKDIILEQKSNTSLMAITMNKKELDSKQRIYITDSILHLLNRFVDKNNIEAHVSGLPYIRTVIATKVSKELSFFTILSVGITALILLLFFRSFSAVFYSMLVVITCVIWCVASIAILGYKVSLLTGVIPPLIVVITIQNCIYLLNVYHFEFSKHHNQALALTRVISKIGLASFLTNITTAVGFAVFSFSGSVLLDQFSIVSTINIIIVYLLTHLMIPTIFSYLAPPKEKELKHLNRKSLSGVLKFVNTVVLHYRKWVYGITILLIVASIIGISKINSIGYMLDDIPKDDPVYMDLKYFESHFKGVMPYEIEIDTKVKNGLKDLPTLQKIDKFQRKIAVHPELSRSICIVDMLKYTNQAYHDGDERWYRLPSVMDMSEITNMLPQGKTNSGLLKSMVDSNYQIARISMQIADIGSHKTKELNKLLRKQLDSIFPPSQFNTHITGTTVIQMKGNDYLIENLTTSMFWALVIISIMMTFMFFSYKMTLISLIPNLIPLIMTMGIMGFAGIPLKNSTILVFSIAYGIVVDLTIHFLAKYRIELKKQNWQIFPAVEHSVAESGFSMIYTTVVLFFGFVIFAFSTFGGTVALGVLTSICLVVGLITNLFLLPSMLLSLEKSINMKKELEKALIEDED